jgi:uncharacterized protein YjbI with pentapeptide repeats
MRLNPDHVAILQQGVKAWNAWRLSPAGAYPDLSEAVVEALDWTTGCGPIPASIDFRAVTLTGAHFQQVDLRVMELDKATLRGAAFLNCKITKTCFSADALRDLVFDDSQLIDCSFDSSDIKHCTFYRALLGDVSFRGTLHDVQFGRSRMRRVEFGRLGRTEIIGGVWFSRRTPRRL